jgi:hypothetical protein
MLPAAAPEAVEPAAPAPVPPVLVAPGPVAPGPVASGPVGRGGLRVESGAASSACDLQSRRIRGAQLPSSMAASVWVAVESADGSLMASSEYPGSGSGSPWASPRRLMPSQAARTEGRFQSENWPGGYTGSGCPGTGGKPRIGPRRAGWGRRP